MRDHDPAFQWETEALREREQRRVATAPPAKSTSPGTWVTLRQAHEATDIPIETLRKWARRGTVRSALEETEFGERRMVDLGDVRTRARHLGRDLKPAPAAPRHEEVATDSEPATPPVDNQPAPVPDQPLREPSEAVAESPQPVPPSASPPGTMIVPIDAWDKMLMQLGNLHEAGQQLAEARERAAKAETEAFFLRERLAELRAEANREPSVAAAAVAALDSVTPPETQPVEADASPDAADETPATPPRMGEPWARVFRAYAAERWRERRRQ